MLTHSKHLAIYSSIINFLMQQYSLPFSSHPRLLFLFMAVSQCHIEIERGSM